MQDQKLFFIFQNTKEVLCKFDYYIYLPKRILRLTNREDQIPHLMGLQYVGRPNYYVGDFGVYAIKKGRIQMPSIEKLIHKYYKNPEKQQNILKMVHLKMDNLHLISEMLTSYSKLYLYNISGQASTKFESDYLLVHHVKGKTVHLGLIKVPGSEKGVYCCNSFITTYQKDRDSDLFYRDLEHHFEIQKIVRENKKTKEREVIYQSEQAVVREQSGIEKMLKEIGIRPDIKLVKSIVQLNQKFGKYHQIADLQNYSRLKKQCRNTKEEALVNDFYMNIVQSYISLFMRACKKMRA